jgi:hypothetical protein
LEELKSCDQDDMFNENGEDEQELENQAPEKENRKRIRKA